MTIVSNDSEHNKHDGCESKVGIQTA